MTRSPFQGERALIVVVKGHHASFAKDAHDAMLETVQLVESLGMEVVLQEVCHLRQRKVRTLFGKGWVEQIAQAVALHAIQKVIVDPELSALQQTNLEKHWKCGVMGRTEVILHVFSQRAKSSAGKLQVELAYLLYQKTRLVRAWSHLERQRGGFGFLGGPGESQLELDRRMLDQRMKKVTAALDKVKRTRTLQRNSSRHFFQIALVGYTNAGKSTLFHALTGANVSRASMPFLTLDPLHRSLRLTSGTKVMLGDTVGFISRLPALLRLAFEATLEILSEADMILHVRDMASIYAEPQKQSVEAILEDMGLKVPVVEIWNKWDLVSENTAKDLLQTQKGVPVSALHKTGIQALLKVIEEVLPEKYIHPSF